MLSLLVLLSCSSEPAVEAPKPAPAKEAPPAKDEAPAKEEAPAEAPTAAKATLEAKSDSGVSGTVTLTQGEDGLKVEVSLAGAKPGKHGLHVHEKGDCSAPDGTSAGGHFNPMGVDHGAPDGQMHHPGDFGNVEVGEDGTGTTSLTTKAVTLGEGPTSIAGLAVIVHADPDDFGQPTGNAGGRIACGVIELEK